MCETQTSRVALYLFNALVSGVRGIGGIEYTRQHPNNHGHTRKRFLFLPMYSAYDGPAYHLFTRFTRFDKIYNDLSVLATASQQEKGEKNCLPWRDAGNT